MLTCSVFHYIWRFTSRLWRYYACSFTISMTINAIEDPVKWFPVLTILISRNFMGTHWYASVRHKTEDVEYTIDYKRRQMAL